MTIPYKPFFSAHLECLAKDLGLTSLSSDSESAVDSSFVLYEKDELIYLSPHDVTLGGDLACNFSSRDYGQYAKTVTLKSALAKACGCKSGFRPSVLDLTAGLGKDSFALASLGCKVTLVEKNPVVYLLLYSGVEKFQKDEAFKFNDIFRSRMTLLPCQPALGVLLDDEIPAVDTIYIDPMFPERKKSAKVKKAMQYFHQIVGEDDNEATLLLDAALKKATKRVVVKRPKGSEFYTHLKPSLSMDLKGLRYDIYFLV